MPENAGYYSEEWKGQKYGHLEILRYGDRHFICLCDCGNITTVRPTFLLSGKIKTCGINCKYHLEDRPRVSKLPLYPVWHKMIYDCYNPKSPQFSENQKRNIGVCDEWKTDIWNFIEWSELHGYEKGKCLTRIRKTEGYSPENCAWVSKGAKLHRHLKIKTNYGVKYDVLGESLTMQEISDKYNLSVAFLRNRLKKGMTMEEAVTTPKYSHTPAYLAKHDIPILPD